MDGYATGKALQQVGVVSGMDMTPEATLAKLHCLLSKNDSADEVRKQMTKNLRGELTP
jgi:L-asparaginase